MRLFKLRTCKCAEPGPEDRAHCLAGAVKDCCCPCTGSVTPEEYREKVDRLIAVLNGEIKEVQLLLKEKMQQAALDKKYEKAGMYRDISANIDALYGARKRSFEHVKLPANIVGENAVKELQTVLKLSKPPEEIECFDISNISGTLAVASLVHFSNGMPNKSKYRRFRIRTVAGPNDFAMMKEAVSRHFIRLMQENQPLPDLLMVDGGKGQLKFAVDALIDINVPAFPVIGLAKRLEEIFIPGREDSILLPHDRNALKLLQAVRDEAHRFAITYHRTLRLNTIKNSILDDIEGIGEKRKAALLEEFGSVRSLRRASPEEISRRVTGIGEEFARQIYEYLQKHQPDGEVDPL